MSVGHPCNIYEIRTSVYGYVHCCRIALLFTPVLDGFWKKSYFRTFFCSSNMLKFLKVTSAPKPIPLGCELPPKPKKHLLMPKSEEPSSDPNLFSQQLGKLYDACHYWVEGSSRQRAFHKDYALRKASKDLGAWFLELQAEVSDLVKLADAQYYDFVHLVSDPLPVATQPQQPLFPPEFRSDESLREVYERFLFFLDHCDRRTNLLAFIQCSKKNCPCAKKPWRAKRFRAELDHLKGLPTPIPHPAHADHFLSCAEHREQRLNADPDTHQPSFAKCPGRCTLCRYVFKSENDKAVHNRLRHPRSGSPLNE